MKTHRIFKMAVRYIFSIMVVLIAAGMVPGVSARPRIGLALGGGGARGIAHVGVLKYLEAHQIPIDCIAGTSMGAIVGGLYAAGMTPEEIERELENMDWADMFSDTPAYRDLSFRRKQDESADLFKLELGFRNGRFMMPGGLITGQKVRFKLQTLTLHAEGTQSFDDLLVPFRAVATDIETGEIVILSGGNLAEAIHASFAIPGLIDPVNINGQLLVDGGLASNVPAQTVRDMGADIVIAVNVGADLADRTRLNSFAMVTKQVVDLMLHANVAESLREADVVITPDLTDFNSADFDKAAEIIPFGRAAAERVSEILKPYQLSATDYQTLTANRRINHGVVSPELDYIDLVNRSSVSNRWILANMETRTGRPLDLDILKKDLVWLFQTNEFTLIDFRLTRRSGEDGLEILTKEKPWGNDTFRFGMTLKDNFEGDSFYTLNMRYTNTRINSLGAEWRTDGQIGREGLFKTEFYQPLAHKTQYFAAVTAKYHRFYANQFEDGDKISDYRVYQYIGQVDTGVELGKYGELRTGVYYGRVNARLSTGKELESNRDIDIGGIAAQLVIDQIDDPGFPTEGYHLIAEYFGVMDALGGESDTQRVQFLYQNYGRWGHNTIFAHLAGGSKIGSDLPFYLKFDLGGPFSLSGYESGAVVGQYMGVARLGYFRQLAIMPAVMGSGLYIGGYVEAGNALDSIRNFGMDDLIYTFNAFVGLDTFLGPLFVGYGAADTGKDAMYLQLGHML